MRIAAISAKLQTRSAVFITISSFEGSSPREVGAWKWCLTTM